MTAMVAITTQRMTVSPTSRSIVSSTADDHTRASSRRAKDPLRKVWELLQIQCCRTICACGLRIIPGVGSLDNGSPGRFCRSASAHHTRRSVLAFSLLESDRSLLSSGDPPRKGVAHECGLPVVCAAGSRASGPRARWRKLRSGKRWWLGVRKRWPGRRGRRRLGVRRWQRHWWRWCRRRGRLGVWRARRG